MTRFGASSNITVVFADNQTGTMDNVNVAEGTTIQEFFVARLGSGARPDQYLVRVNNQHVDSDYVLQDGNRISFTPKHIKGA